MSSLTESKLSTIQPNSCIKAAHKMMSDFNYRHLPVMDGDKLLGILSDRDVSLALVRQEKTGEEITAQEYMSAPVVTVDKSESLATVLDKFIQHKIHAVVVVDGPKIATILTEVDLFRVLKLLLLNPEDSPKKFFDQHALHDANLVRVVEVLNSGLI